MGALFNNNNNYNNNNKCSYTANNCFVMRAMQKKRLNLSLKCTSDYISNAKAVAETNIHPQMYENTSKHIFTYVCYICMFAYI